MSTPTIKIYNQQSQIDVLIKSFQGPVGPQGDGLSDAEIQAALDATKQAQDAAAQADAAREGIEGELSTLKDTKAPGIEVEASGALVTVDDAAAMRTAELFTRIAPTTDGLNKVGVKRTGRNLIKPSFGTVTTQGVTFTANDDGSVTISGTATSTIGQRISDDFADVFLPKGVNYHIFLADDAPNAAVTLQAYIDAASKFNSQNGYLIIPETTSSVYLRIRVGAGVEINETVHPMVVIAEDNAGWEDGKISTLTATLSEMVYGGTLDWKTGTLIVTHHLVELTGEEEWGAPDMQKDGTYRFLMTGALKSNLLVPESNDSMPNAACSHFAAQSYSALYNGNTPGFSFSQSKKLSIRGAYASTDELNAYLAEQKVTIAYPVTNPHTVNLTPQQLDMLKGTNNVWSDTGDTSLVYVADTKMYIDKKFDALAAALLSR